MSSIDSELLAVNGNTIEFSDAGDSQGGLSQPRLREETGRLQRSLRNLKGLLTRDVNQCKDKVAHFKLKYVEDYITVTNAKLLYAQNIIDNFNQVSTRFINLEGALDKLRDLECATWIGTDEDLDGVLNKLTQDSITYGDQCIKLQRDNDEILEICNNLIAASKPAVVTRPRNTGAGIPANQPNINFKPSSELKPTFLARDCTLLEFLKFGDTFVIYMNSAGQQFLEMQYFHIRESIWTHIGTQN